MEKRASEIAIERQEFELAEAKRAAFRSRLFWISTMLLVGIKATLAVGMGDREIWIVRLLEAIVEIPR